MTPVDENNDTDLRKGVVEEEDPKKRSQSSLRGQLGHRDEDPRIKGNDTDFPEPGENEEHTGLASDGINAWRRKARREDNPEGATQDQDPGHRQKENQNKKKDDDLAA
jgi:hypothetical protein